MKTTTGSLEKTRRSTDSVLDRPPALMGPVKGQQAATVADGG